MATSITRNDNSTRYRAEVALFDKKDAQHARCRMQLQQTTDFPLLTTWATVTEAMYLLGRAGGWRLQKSLGVFLKNGLVEIVHLDAAATTRVFELMEKYRDLPMDVADATLVALAEAHRTNVVWTLDSDFRVYQTTNGALGLCHEELGAYFAVESANSC